MSGCDDAWVLNNGSMDYSNCHVTHTDTHCYSDIDQMLVLDFDCSDNHIDCSDNHIDCSDNHFDCSDNICVDAAMLSQSVPGLVVSQTAAEYYLQPIYIPYLDFHRLFYSKNEGFSPDTQLANNYCFRNYVTNDNKMVKTSKSNSPYTPFNLYQILKNEFMGLNIGGSVGCVDVCSRLDFDRAIAPIKTLFDIGSIRDACMCNPGCSLGLDELFLSMEANGLMLDPYTGMPNIEIYGSKCVIVNITTRFKNCEHQVDIIWPFFVDLMLGFDCIHCGTVNSRYSCACLSKNVGGIKRACDLTCAGGITPGPGPAPCPSCDK